jgi:outer membrane lipoprotein-sorting protein
MSASGNYLKYLLALLFIGASAICKAEPMTFSAAELFDAMEKKTDRIEAVSALVELTNSTSRSQVTLSVKSPDRFSIVFADESVKVCFNGQKLWIYVKAINEVFYHFSETQGSVASYFSLINPKKIFTSLTRKTLFSLFDVIPLKKQTLADGSTNFYLKFVPRMRSVFREVFSVGFYEMVFSDKSYLPVEVIEYDQCNLERGRLKVIDYRLNGEIADGEFEFSVPDGAVMVPVSVVIAQKIEEYAKSLMEKAGEAAEKLKRSLYDWSF